MDECRASPGLREIDDLKSGLSGNLLKSAIEKLLTGIVVLGQHRGDAVWRNQYWQRQDCGL